MIQDKDGTVGGIAVDRGESPSVQVFADPRRLQLSDGPNRGPLSCLSVRRLRRSTTNRIAEHGRLGPTLGDQARFTELVVRASIVGSSYLCDAITGQPVPFSTESVSGIGPVASTEVYDALSDEDVANVMRLAQGGPMSEVKEGN